MRRVLLPVVHCSIPHVSGGGVEVGEKKEVEEGRLLWAIIHLCPASFSRKKAAPQNGERVEDLSEFCILPFVTTSLHWTWDLVML